ncbi:GTPase-activating protein skywalker [Caerostris extrusa]|uniref:GTPase-activating protein skywalker n=1 Tax=Caerostris extrusa TaxID=172846 RepID=A0AAV4S3B4_CAEEX|nr:GTPase-activating protein skywalker [Caerostris extrusa]
MPSHSLNAKFVNSKSIERLCAGSQDVLLSVSDVSSITNTADIRQIKEIVRNNQWPVDHPIRKELWQSLCDEVSRESHVDIYNELVKTLFGDNYVPSSLPSLVDPVYCIRYYLNGDGKKSVERILQVIREAKPDITYCPILYPLVCLFLHYMSEEMTFSCIMKLLSDRQNYFSQTKSDHLASAYLVMKLSKKYAVRFAISLLDPSCGLFLVDRKKSVYRIVIALLVLYYKNADKSVNNDLGSLQKLLDFSKYTSPCGKSF